MTSMSFVYVVVLDDSFIGFGLHNLLVNFGPVEYTGNFVGDVPLNEAEKSVQILIIGFHVPVDCISMRISWKFYENLVICF